MSYLKRPFGASFKLYWGRYRSGQTGQTVNLLAFAFVGSNPTRPTRINLLIYRMSQDNMIKMQCTETGAIRRTHKNKKTLKGRLELMLFSKAARKHTLHRETK